MRIERTIKIDGKELYFESISLNTLKRFINVKDEKVLENKLETFGSIVMFTYKYEKFNYVATEEYVICEIGEEENDDEKLAKALRIIYEKMAEDIVNNILLSGVN